MAAVGGRLRPDARRTSEVAADAMIVGTDVACGSLESMTGRVVGEIAQRHARDIMERPGMQQFLEGRAGRSSRQEDGCDEAAGTRAEQPQHDALQLMGREPPRASAARVRQRYFNRR